MQKRSWGEPFGCVRVGVVSIVLGRLFYHNFIREVELLVFSVKAHLPPKSFRMYS